MNPNRAISAHHNRNDIFQDEKEPLTAAFIENYPITYPYLNMEYLNALEHITNFKGTTLDTDFKVAQSGKPGSYSVLTEKYESVATCSDKRTAIYFAMLPPSVMKQLIILARKGLEKS